MAILQAFNDDSPAEQIKLERSRSVMGRHPECDIVLDSAAVSRQHALILIEADDYYIEDMHSRNGTFVNGAATQGRQLLHDGDRIKICDLTFTFYRQAPGQNLFNSGALQGSTNMLSLAELYDDGPTIGTSTIMSKLDASPNREARRSHSIVNPEVKLRAMMEIIDSLSKAVTVDEVLPKLLDSMFKIFIQADRGFIILRKDQNGPLVPKAIKYRRADMEDRVRISRTIINQVMEAKEAILSADAASDMRFESSQSIADLRIRSMMCAPLVDSDGKALGVIQIDTLDQRQRFQKDDLELLVSIATQAANAIDTAQMHEYALRRQALERDLELAHKVQRGLLPAHPPTFSGYHFFDFYEPANQVGGDYYDYIEIEPDLLAIVLGDVSGKGVSAALLMAKLSGEVRFCLASERSPARAMDRINAVFCRSGWDDRFVTFVLAVLDRNKNEVTIVNAGHMPPMLRHADGTLEDLGEEEAGLPLGIDVDYQYEQITCSLGVGESLTIFTDGISEAMNAASDLYGLERLRTQVAASATTVETLGRHILDDVRQFVGGRPQSDDMCLACFGRML